MASKSIPVIWRQCLGRNTWDHPLVVPENMGVEALNVDLREGSLGTKRAGSATVSTTGDSFSGTNHLARFTPAQDPSADTLFLVSNDSTKKIIKIASAAAAVDLTLADTIDSRPTDVSTAQLNGKLFFAYDSDENRLHVYDPTISTTAVGRAGLKAPAAPTVGNTGAGAYPNVQRWYRQRNRIKSGSVILRQGEPSASVSFTPSGTGTAARVTKAAATGDGETHWVVEASAVSTDGPFYELAEIAVGTTTYDDSADVETYDENEPSPLLGTYYPFPSTKFILSDGVRLFGLGVWETTAGDSLTPVSGRLYFTPPFGAREFGDADQVINSSLTRDDWIDLSITAGGVDRGLGGPILGRIFAFQNVGIYMIVPTTDPDVPVKRVVISDKQGAVSNHSIVKGEDESGNPVLYFLDPNDGPRRVGVGGDVQWLGKDVKDIWDTVNLSASTVVAWGLYDPPRKQVKWWVSVGSENEPTTTIITYHVTLGITEATGDVRMGWSKWNGELAKARHGVMFASTLAATRPLTQVPYAGNATTALFRQDGTSNQDYGSVSYQGYVRSKAWEWGPVSRLKRLVEGYVLAKVQAATSILHSVITDWGLRTITESVSLAGTGGSETRIRQRVQAVDVNNTVTQQIQLGDSAAANTTWSLDRWNGEVEVTEGKAA